MYDKMIDISKSTNAFCTVLESHLKVYTTQNRSYLEILKLIVASDK